MESLIDLPSECVYCIPLPSGEAALFIPVLPENVRYTSDAYREFLEAFEEITLSPRDSLSGFVRVRMNSDVVYTANVLTPFLEVLHAQEAAVVVPYCYVEGLPLQDIYGVVLPSRIDQADIQQDIV